MRGRWSLCVVGLAMTIGSLGCGSAPVGADVDGGRGTDSGAPTDAGPGLDAGAPTDAGGPGDAGTASDGGAFEVGALPGLVLWLESTHGVTRFDGGTVAGWADRSGRGNDAFQSVTYNRPTWTEQAIGGRPGVHFDMDAMWGQFLTIDDAPTLQWGTDDFTLAVVARYDNETGSTGSASRFGMFFFKQTATAGLAFQANSPGQVVTSGVAIELDPDPTERLVSTGTGYNDLQGHLFVARRVGTSLQLRHNGVADGAKTVPVVDVSAVGQAVHLGATLERIDSTRLNGDLAELVAIKGPLGDVELLALEAYLKAKYALP